MVQMIMEELEKDHKINKEDLKYHLPLSSKEFESLDLNIQWLGHYLQFHPQKNYYFAREKVGFVPNNQRTEGTYSRYVSLDDKLDGFHFYLAFIKFGIGRATYDSSQEVRNGDLTRQEAVALIHKYDGEFPTRWADEIFEYLSINSREFPIASKAFEKNIFDKTYYDDLSNKFRSPHLWYLDESNKWNLRFKVKDLYEKEKNNIALNWEGNIKKDFDF